MNALEFREKHYVNADGVRFILQSPFYQPKFGDCIVDLDTMIYSPVHMIGINGELFADTIKGEGGFENGMTMQRYTPDERHKRYDVLIYSDIGTAEQMKLHYWGYSHF